MKRAFYTIWILAGVIFGSGLIAAPSPAQKVTPGTAQGELTVNAKPIPLRFAYASDIDNSTSIQTMADTNAKTGFVLILTDVTIPLEAVTSASGLNSLMKAGKVNGIRIRFDADGKMHTGQLYYGLEAGKKSGSLISFNNPPPSFPQSFAFQNLKIGPDRISGTALMPNVESFPGASKAETITWQYKADFAARIVHLPPVTAILTGAVAKSSPQIQTILANNAAYLKDDIGTARRYETPAASQDIEVSIAKDGKEKVLSMLKSLVSDRETTLKHLSRIVVRGNQATVVYDGKDFISSQVLRKVNGVWLVDLP